MTHLPLGREVSVPRRDTEEEAVKLCQHLRSDDGIVWFRRGVHLDKDFVGKGF